MAKTALEIFFKHQENSSNIGKHSSFASTMVGENFEIQDSKMANTAFKIFLNSRKIPQIWANINLYPPPWLEKILNFDTLKWLKMRLKSSSTKVLA